MAEIKGEVKDLKRKPHERYKRRTEVEFQVHIDCRVNLWPTMWPAANGKGKARPATQFTMSTREETNELLRKNCVTYSASFFPLAHRQGQSNFSENHSESMLSQVTKRIRLQILIHVELLYGMWQQCP